MVFILKLLLVVIIAVVEMKLTMIQLIGREGRVPNSNKTSDQSDGFGLCRQFATAL